MIDDQLRTKLHRFQQRALIVGVAGLALCGLGAFLNPRQFFFSYLFGYLFWMGITLGSFALLMLHHLVGGRWGFVIRRFLETGITTLPLMVLLFLPILFGLDDLYAWARPAQVAKDEILQTQSHYLNLPSFAVRMILVFGIWLVMAWLLNKWSFQQDKTPDPEPTRRLRKLSGPGLVIFVLTVTFAYVDWVMALELHWFSTIFPILGLIGQVMTTLAFSIMLLAWFGQREPLSGVLTATHFHHLANLMMAFMLLWTYMSFSQLLIIWSGNLPGEITWYLHRSSGGWEGVGIFLALFHFAVPFGFLLMRAIKRRTWSITSVALWLFLAHAVNVFWFIAPSFHTNALRIHWLDFAAPMGVGGIWLATFFALLKRRDLLPQNDPRLQLTVAHAS